MPTREEFKLAWPAAVRGTALAMWRVLRCSPLSRGGIDLPPAALPWVTYDTDIQTGRAAA